MRYLFLSAVIALVFAGCNTKHSDVTFSQAYLQNQLPQNEPLPFMPTLVSPDSIIHRGSFSNDLSEYFYTVSNKDFSHFDVKVVQKINGDWAKPQNAFFNSPYNEHGLSFSPDGNTLVFSSTRPVKIDGVVDTWHIWKSERRNGEWADPEFVDIPNLRNKLVSHPSLDRNGNLFFHSGNPDYSDLDVFYSKPVNGKFLKAEKVKLSTDNSNGNCTPYISFDGDYLIFATIGDYLELKICYRLDENEWTEAKSLPETINDKGQGNPYISPDGEFLFYASESKKAGDHWNVNWVSTKSFLSR